MNIWVIIPVYGNWEDTVECLRALDTQQNRDFQIIVADDGSPTPPPPAVYRFQRVHYFRYGNAGFAANCNRAAREAIQRGATHLLILNSDTTFGPQFLNRWMAIAAEWPNSILSPLIFCSQTPDRIWTSGGALTVLTPFVRARRRYASATEVDTATGCAMFIPVTVWTAVDGFDPRYHMYFEDFDLTVRAKASGIRTYVLPDLETHVWHRVSGSFRRERVWCRYYHIITSSVIFIRSHYRGARQAICLLLAAMHLGITTILLLPELPRPKPLWNALRCGFAPPAQPRI